METIYSPDLDTGDYAAKFAAVPNAFGIIHQQISWLIIRAKYLLFVKLIPANRFFDY